MAGHSHAKNVMHRKGAQDARRARAFGKIIREITTAARIGLPDPAANPRLRAAIAWAREENMTRDTIERAIRKASGPDAGVHYTEARYEGYGPGGVAVIVEALTDNLNRTVSNIRSAFSKYGGVLGETNSVSFQFRRIGVIRYPSDRVDPDVLFQLAADAGADDVVTDADGADVVTTMDGFFGVRDALAARFGEPSHARVEWRPQTTVTLDDEKGALLLRLVEALDDDDDVQNVYVNGELPASLEREET